jgi:hypothetical protein
MSYVYIHTRLDTNEIFYIGISSNNINGKYTRAFSKKGRGKFWRDLTKNVLYKVDIIFDNLTWEEACSKEIELIAKHGRRDLSLGTLVNLTNGGDGVNGYQHNDERILKLKMNAEGSKNPNAKTCTHFDTKTSFKSLKEGCEYFGLNYKTQKNAILKKYSTAQFYFDNEYFERVTKEEISKKLSKIRVEEQNHRFGKPAWNKRKTI